MARVLILFAHPALEKSRVHRRLIGQVPEPPGLTFHDLYEAYPDFGIDVPHEQALLLNHDLILFQHPFYWYSAPPILKQWEDLVLEHGWAYGSQGVALRGKRWLNMGEADIEVEAARYRQLLVLLHEDRLDLAAAEGLPALNPLLDHALTQGAVAALAHAHPPLMLPERSGWSRLFHGGEAERKGGKWTPLFAQAAAVVTDIGGPLSHSSIVAREYGIPAVMAARTATHAIHSGQLVTVDGNAGTVTLEG